MMLAAACGSPLHFSAFAMKFLLSFVVVLVLILAYFRLFPSAPINPVLPI